MECTVRHCGLLCILHEFPVLATCLGWDKSVLFFSHNDSMTKMGDIFVYNVCLHDNPASNDERQGRHKRDAEGYVCYPSPSAFPTYGWIVWPSQG